MNFMHRSLHRFYPLLGRILIGSMFLMAGISKLFGFAGIVGYIVSVGLPSPELLAVIAIIFEIGGGLSLILGYKAHHGALALVLFTILASVFFHTNFGDQTQMALFTKNFAIIGGLLYIMTFGAGAFSLDSRKSTSSM